MNSGTRPFLIYARPTREKVPIQFANDRANLSASAPGFVYSLARASPNQAAKVVAALSPSVTTRLFSPDIDLLPHTKKSGTPAYDFSWPRNLPPIDASASRAAGWLQDVVEAQVDLGATALITPSLPLEPTHGETELRQMLGWARRARSTPGGVGGSFLTGLTLHRTWLSNPTKLELLLNVLTDSDDPGYYIVIRWSSPTKSDQQISEKGVLEGLVELVEVLDDDERETVIARTGLAGWVLIALGASAFSASPYPAHILRDPVTFARKKGSPSIPRVPLYLDRQLLSYVEFARMNVVTQVSGTAHCGCPDCGALMNGYQDQAAFRHYLSTLADLTEAMLATTNRRGYALQQVNRAQALLSSNPALGLPTRTTVHLAVWESLLN